MQSRLPLFVTEGGRNIYRWNLTKPRRDSCLSPARESPTAMQHRTGNRRVARCLVAEGLLGAAPKALGTQPLDGLGERDIELAHV